MSTCTGQRLVIFITGIMELVSTVLHSYFSCPVSVKDIKTEVQKSVLMCRALKTNPEGYHNVPSEITCIDTRIDKSCPPPLVSTLENCDPKVSSLGQVGLY